MKITMVTEGTYPVHSGGVSVWCSQIIRGMPDHEFEIVALTGSGTERLAYELPSNVTALRRLGLWAPGRRPKWVSKATKRRFAAAYEQFLHAIVETEAPALERFEESLHDLHEAGMQGGLTSMLCSQHGVDLFLDAWAHRSPEDRIRVPAADLRLADVLAIIDLIDHYLRPLHARPPRVDLVHTTANGPSAMIGLAAKWEYGTPVLMTEHGVYLRERLLAMRAADLTSAVKVFMMRFFIRLTELGYRSADVIAPVNQFNRRWEVRNGAPPESIRTIHNGVDPGSFPAAQSEPAAAPVLVFVGRIDPLKDLQTLIRAFALVRSEVPTARLRLFGPVPAGNEPYADNCEKLVVDLGLDHAVSFEGPIMQPSMAYEAGHVVVLSSISEGLPYSLIEAMACGRATVSTDVGGVAEAVGETGLIVPPRDSTALASACTRLLLDHSLRRRLGESARRRAMELFTLDRQVESYRDLYAELEQRERPPRHAEATVRERSREPRAREVASR